MENDTRPDPDMLLAAIQKDDERLHRGKLKIFLGMVAGVGKTYAMLDAARRLKGDGLDAVVGYAETHGRAETDALLAGLEIIPRRRVEYRGAVLEELDTDAILARRPALVLVDELAHTNAPESRHLKRYQDVIELLEAGIDVWTTVNVQHFESRSDAVRQITGITIHETVPDSMLDLADEIELIDLSPADLRKRLAEGKVYTAERIDAAANNFFRVGNLTALREMALRLTAEHVDHTLQDYMQLKQIAGPWKSGERLMVAVGPSPFSERLIRWTRRIAYNLEAAWLAVYVDTAQPLSPEAKARLAQNITLARNLGGEIITVSGENVPTALLRVARQRNVTQIVVGKPQHTRWQQFLRGGSLVDQIIRESGDIDIYVVTGDKTNTENSLLQLVQPELHSHPKQYLVALLVLGVVILLDIVLSSSLPWLGSQAVGLTQLFVVLLIAAYLGRGPALLAAVVSALSWNFIFIAPRLTLAVAKFEDVILLMLYFAIAIFTGNLTARLRVQEHQSRHSAERTSALYTLAHETATAVNMDDVLKTAVTQISTVFDSDVAILLPRNGRLEREPHASSTFTLDDKDFSVAAWAYEHGKPAGRFTATLSQAAGQFHPLHTPTRIVGVVGIRTKQSDGQFSFEQEIMLETFMSQIALVIEREMLDEAAEQAAVLQESERLYTVLLNSISHELRTPIATIKGASSSMLNPVTGGNENARILLTKDIQSAADRLNRLVENLLDMSRLESGRLQLKKEWCDLRDVVGVAVQRVDDCAGSRALHVQSDVDLPLVLIDFVLIEQVIVNILDNACNYTPEGTSILVEVRNRPNNVEVIISDNGSGIPSALLERIFDKFYRLPGTATGGTGLGLSISRSLIEAHNGTLMAENRPEGGARFRLHLPVTGTPPPVEEALYE